MFLGSFGLVRRNICALQPLAGLISMYQDGLSPVLVIDFDACDGNEHDRQAGVHTNVLHRGDSAEFSLLANPA